MLSELAERRSTILDAVCEVPGLSCPLTPSGAFYVFAKNNIPGMTSMDLTEYLIEEGGVAVAPGSAFGSEGEGYFRISFSVSNDDCLEGMDRIAKAMAQLQKDT
jgi:aspartate/methionine/tyrosine aminotransferase